MPSPAEVSVAAASAASAQRCMSPTLKAFISKEGVSGGGGGGGSAGGGGGTESWRSLSIVTRLGVRCGPRGVPSVSLWLQERQAAGEAAVQAGEVAAEEVRGCLVSWFLIYQKNDCKHQHYRRYCGTHRNGASGAFPILVPEDSVLLQGFYFVVYIT